MREHNKYCWEGKRQRAEMAKSHTEKMAQRYGERIEECVDATRTYTGPIDAQNGNPTAQNVQELPSSNVCSANIKWEFLNDNCKSAPAAKCKILLHNTGLVYL